LGNINAKHLKKHLKSNSAIGRERADEIRKAHAAAQK
jgi:hypothetical protein